MMTLGDDHIKKKFDDIDDRINLMMEYCRSLELENKTLLLKIDNLKLDLDRGGAETEFSGQETFIQSKIDTLLEKLHAFSNSPK